MKFVLVLLFFAFSFFPTSLSATMSGGDFEIYADTFSSFQGDTSSGGDFTLYSTGGDPFATSTSGGTFTLNGGFLAAERSSVALYVDPTSVSLGQLSLSEVKSASSILTVTTDATTGYTVTATTDGNLRKGNGGGTDDINNVSDGSVTAGSEEYGIITSGSAGQLAIDTGLSDSLAIASNASAVTDEETTVTFKASVGSQSRAGNYSQVVTFTITANP